jgi:hypothetical protein
MLDGHKSHINYTSVDFCRTNNILLYALPPHTTHVLQPSEIPFAKLKKEYSAGCDKLRFSNDGELVTKHSFAKVLGPAFIATYTPTAICNAFRATGIWPFNPDAITPDRLEPSLATERFDTPTPPQVSTCRTPKSQAKETPTKTPSSLARSTRSSTVQLKEKNKLLKSEIDVLKKETTSLKRSLQATQKELETYKNLGTCTLQMVLKYPLPRNLPLTEEQASTDRSLPSATKPNLISFQSWVSQSPNTLHEEKKDYIHVAQLLTDAESSQRLKAAEEATRKAEEAKQENAAQKRAARGMEKARNQEERRRKKEEQERKKEMGAIEKQGRRDVVRARGFNSE